MAWLFAANGAIYLLFGARQRPISAAIWRRRPDQLAARHILKDIWGPCPVARAARGGRPAL